MVFNPTDSAIATNLTLPLYYTGTMLPRSPLLLSQKLMARVSHHRHINNGTSDRARPRQSYVHHSVAKL